MLRTQCCPGKIREIKNRETITTIYIAWNKWYYLKPSTLAILRFTCKKEERTYLPHVADLEGRMKFGMPRNSVGKVY